MLNENETEGIRVTEPGTGLKYTNAMTERNDTIDNAVYECILALAEKDEEELPWDMEIIGEVINVIKETLESYGIYMRLPVIATEKDGSQHFDEQKEKNCRD